MIYCPRRGGVGDPRPVRGVEQSQFRHSGCNTAGGRSWADIDLRVESAPTVTLERALQLAVGMATWVDDRPAGRVHRYGYA